MRFRTGLVGFSVLALLLLPTTATAGGWMNHIDLQARYLGSGEMLTVRSRVMFETLETAEEERRVDYRAYLVRGLDTTAAGGAMSQSEYSRRWTPPAEMTLIGDVELSRWDANTASAAAHLTIPEMTPGYYHLVLCDVGCRTPLGNLVPLRVQVSADPFSARVARGLEEANARLELGFIRVRSDLRRTQRQVRAARSAASEAAAGHAAAAEVAAATHDLIARSEERISALEAGSRSDPWTAYPAWFLIGAATALVGVRFWRRRAPALSPSAPEVSVEPMPDGDRELISSR